ncbi:MAG: type II toxin-antitoxin system Phd/YefM family antitoxin [Anaerolineaceae bacterium]
MEFIPYRDLRNEPSAVRRKLEDQGELIVTMDGKPFAVMIDLSNNENIEDTLIMISRMRAQMAARSIRSQAKRAGLDRMRTEQIDKIIASTRKKQA